MCDMSLTCSLLKSSSTSSRSELLPIFGISFLQSLSEPRRLLSATRFPKLLLCVAACTILGTAFDQARHCLPSSKAQRLEQLGYLACSHACPFASNQVRRCCTMSLVMSLACDALPMTLE